MKVFSTSRPRRAEDQRSRIGRSGAERIEIHLLAGEVGKTLDFRPHEDMQFGWEQIKHVGDLALNIRHLVLVLLERVGVDDRSINAAQVEQRIDVLRRPPRHDRQNMQIVTVIDHAGHLRGKADRCALQQTSGEADGPGVDGLLRFSTAVWSGCCGGASRRACSSVGANMLRLRIHQGRRKGQQQRSPCCEHEQRA